MDGQISEFDVLESIRNHADQLRPSLLNSAIICMGEYVIRLILGWNLLNKMEGLFPLFIDRSSENIKRWSQSRIYSQSVVGLDEDVGTHLWFNVLSHITRSDTFITRLRDRAIHHLQKAILASTIWDGFSSCLLPFLSSRFKEWRIDAVAIALLPSEYQPSDAHFNAVSAVGRSLINDSMPLILINRDRLESYIGADRKGTNLRGNTTIRYILELILSKETLVQELVELSRVFGVNTYTILLASGTSLRVYGSLENILNSALLRPLLTFDLSSSTVGYILLRIPVQLKDDLSTETIEREVSKWFREKTELKSLEITEPVYVEDINDRIDVIAFVGGFGKTKTFSPMLDRIEGLKNDAIAEGLIKEDEWHEIIENVTDGHR